jgi:hypothetical protein
MDSAQEQHEREVGAQLIEWYNQQHGTCFCFDSRPVKAPDLKYRDGNRWLGIEVVEAFYDDANDAKYKWLRARRKPDAPDKWSGELQLMENINSKIATKCQKSYGPNCLLAVYVFADMTCADDLETLLKDVRIPADMRFDGIYVCAECAVPIGLYFSRGRPPPERRVWPVWANEPIG